jgi:S-adenosylmethionine:tRNA ribosyltransferase-isomerase
MTPHDANTVHDAAERAEPAGIRLLVVDPGSARMHSSQAAQLPEWLRAGDLLVLNDAATLPASLSAVTRDQAPVEIRLLGPARAGEFSAVLFGAGDHRTRTEDRPAPPRLHEGDVLVVGPRLQAEIVGCSGLSQRLVELRFDARDAELWSALYAWGKPVQYADQPEPLPLWSVQTAYAARPWAAEMPSAGRPLSMRTISLLRRRGVRFAVLTHAAGLSATGDPELDRALPLPERYDIPAETVRAVERTRAERGRVVAVGTSVVRALEDSALQADGALRAGEALATLRIEPTHTRRIVDGLFTGIHAPGESHFALLGAFADEALLRRSHAYARSLGYREHEFGDACLLLADSLVENRERSAA